MILFICWACRFMKKYIKIRLQYKHSNHHYLLWFIFSVFLLWKKCVADPLLARQQTKQSLASNSITHHSVVQSLWQTLLGNMLHLVTASKISPFPSITPNIPKALSRVFPVTLMCRFLVTDARYITHWSLD